MTDRTTPLPWRAIHGAGGPCVAGIGRTVAALGPLEVNDPDAEDHANAALIVRRVNAGPAADVLAEAVATHFNLPGPVDERFQALVATYREATGEKR